MASNLAPGSIAFTFVLSGKTELYKAFAANFDGFENEMIAKFISPMEPDEHKETFGEWPLLPLEWRRKGVQASAHFVPTLLQIIAVLREPVEKGLVQVLSSEFFKEAFARIKSFFGTGQQGKTAIQLPLHFRPSLWLSKEEVLVTVIASLNTREDVVLVETVVPMGFERALSWIEKHGRTHRYLTYRIVDGKLSPVPDLSDEEPAK